MRADYNFKTHRYITLTTVANSLLRGCIKLEKNNCVDVFVRSKNV